MRFLIRILTITALMAAVHACADPYYTAAPVEAWVVDGATGAPIEGAVVTANWQLVAFGFDTGGRRAGQLEVMETVTDRNGRFYFPGFTKVNLSGNALREEDPQILVFKPGYRYMRVVNQYPIGKEEEQGTYRKSPIIGQKIRMQKADEDIKKYAFNLMFLGNSLSQIADDGVEDRILKMATALGCERLRLRTLDPTIIAISVPGPVTLEANCATR